jgi:U2 small nuclear ribonucleoprotein B''
MSLTAPGTSSIPPSCTLYVRNLNEKLPKKQLKYLLYSLFSAYGQVFDIVALKTLKMRGQAFIVYGSIEDATTALRSCQGMSFVGNQLAIQYAMGRSNILNVIQGTYRPSVKSSLKRSGDTMEGTEKKSREEEKSHILFISNLGDASDIDLESLFQEHDGFKEIRRVPGKELAFVEYESVKNASVAKEILDGFQLHGNRIKVEFSKS